MPHVSSVMSMRRASGSALGSEMRSEGVATGVRLCWSGDTPGWGVETGVDDAGLAEELQVETEVMVGVRVSAGEVSTAMSVVKRLSWVGEEARDTQASSSSRSITPALAIQTRQVTLRV